MIENDCGQIIVPTGGGKTYIMIADCDRIVSQTDRNYKTFVVVAPRILLANQLSSEFQSAIKNVKIAHVHSGETHHFSTTNSHELSVYHNNTLGDKLILSLIHI